MSAHYMKTTCFKLNWTPINSKSTLNLLPQITGTCNNKYPRMVEESKGPKRHMAEELTSRFRSKEDLYRYLTQQGKSTYDD